MSNNMHHNPELDDELADLTDKLLAGQDMEVSAENEQNARLVKRLHHLITSEPTVSAAYRTRLTRRLNEEWDETYRRQPTHLLPINRFLRFAALAAAIVVVLGVVLVLSGTLVTPGTTPPGPIESIFPVIFIAVIALVGFVLWRRRH